MKIDEGATNLNLKFENSSILKMFSSKGLKAYFPKGIVAQSNEAASNNVIINATAGVALKNSNYYTNPLIENEFVSLSSDEVVGYAPTGGIKPLREVWQKSLYEKNSLAKGKSFSLPMVTSGITNALYIASHLFVDEGDVVIWGKPSWDNYDLINQQAKVVNYNLFDENGVFDIDSLTKSVEKIKNEKIVLLFNFPNNPTGYTPTTNQMNQIKDVIHDLAEKGKKVVVIVDDAYWGLFHTKECSKNSLFFYLADLHPNVLAIKCDGATKEDYSWGLRIGFLTYSLKGATNELYQALEEKTAAVIRALISSSSKVGQSLLLKALTDNSYVEYKIELDKIIKTKYEKLLSLVNMKDKDPYLIPLNSNSGYFFTFYCPNGAHPLRELLLNEDKIGTVVVDDYYLRVAYSAVDQSMLETLISSIYKRSQQLWRS